jgi:hypothetical protein
MNASSVVQNTSLASPCRTRIAVAPGNRAASRFPIRP